MMRPKENEIELETYAIQPLIIAVCNYFDLSKEEVLGKRRLKQIVNARHMLYYLAYVKTKYTLPEIGRMLGRDHTTILHGYQKVKNQKGYDPDLELDIIKVHHLALRYEVVRRERLEKDREDNARMIARIQMEKLNGLRAEA
jgi:chromosomal replication initiation ATPase DnaA